MTDMQIDPSALDLSRLDGRAAYAAAAASQELSPQERSKARREARRAASVQLLRQFCEVGLSSGAAA